MESNISITDLAKVSSWHNQKLWDYVGGLSVPSKMPGFGYGISAKKCKTGGKLQKVEGSTCNKCYALRGHYSYEVVQIAHERRLKSIKKKFWVHAMAELINRKANPYFRWHDSGDLQNVEHFAKICSVAELTSTINHWIPTREYKIVSDYSANGGLIPSNLCVRFSAHMIGGIVPTFPRLKNIITISTVSKDDSYESAYNCPARFQENNCGDCRACWNPEIFHVDYHYH